MGSEILICGFDEAGRGPLAGPVTAGAVILPKDFPVEILNDSKKLSPKKRALAEKMIKETACWGVGIVSHEKIDEINILQASLLAMQLAYTDLEKKLPDFLQKQGILQAEISIEAITDGNFCPTVPIPCKAEPKADAKYPAVMAASIIAKEERDRIMVQYDALYPAYGYKKHKGYPTPAHLKICREIGPSPIQRRTFSF